MPSSNELVKISEQKNAEICPSKKRPRGMFMAEGYHLHGDREMRPKASVVKAIIQGSSPTALKSSAGLISETPLFESKQPESAQP